MPVVKFACYYQGLYLCLNY